MEREDRDPGFDLSAAGLRADDADVAAFAEVLAFKLENALPERCTVERGRRRPLRRQTRVLRVVVDLGSRRFTLHRHHRHVVAEIETTVHDMRRRTERVDLTDWLNALHAELEQQAAESAEARAALERLLRSPSH